MSLNEDNLMVERVKQNLNLFDSFDAVYLFGSVLKKEDGANDIDLLLVYSKKSKTFFEDLKSVRKVLEESCGLPVDLTVLSFEESRETCFLDKIKPYLRLK